MSASLTIRASRSCKVRKRNKSDLRGQAVQEEEVLPISMMAHQQIGWRRKTKDFDAPISLGNDCYPAWNLDHLYLCFLLSPCHRPNFLFSSKEENSPLKVIDFGFSDFVKADERLNDIVGSAYYVALEAQNLEYFELSLRQNQVAENGKWNLQALVKNSTDAMNDSRVIDFVNTISMEATETGMTGAKTEVVRQ
ncbi:hypothetical protein ZWY2020_032985 [Hordeum vulgare]|nr:hypothetical protein ZWY2020_032985 [Hordeum vulgare]